MKITEIVFGKTYNTGNYNSKRVTLTAKLDENDNAEAVMKDLEVRLDVASGTIDMDEVMEILSDTDNYTGKQVREAQAIYRAMYPATAEALGEVL